MLTRKLHFSECFYFLKDQLYFSDGQKYYGKKHERNDTVYIKVGTLHNNNKNIQYNITRFSSFLFSVKRILQILFEKQDNASKVIDFSSVFYEICVKNVLNCPWLFRCQSNISEVVSIKKACDFNFDCEDQSE